MASIHPYGVEFIGGPFDGYKHVVDFPPADLASIVTLPMRLDAVGLADGQPGHAATAAVYELCNPHGVCSYRYLGASRLPAEPVHRRVG